MNETELRSALDSLPFEVDQVAIQLDGQKLIAVVVSAKFENMDEGERQRLVWQHLQETFSAVQLVQVEFVFTNTPQEDKELAS